MIIRAYFDPTGICGNREKMMKKWIKGAATLIAMMAMAGIAHAAEWNFYGNA
jgi:hypothetical protein